MHDPDNPTGRIQLPDYLALLFVGLFVGPAHMILTIAANREQDGFPLFMGTALLGYVMGRCLHDLSLDARRARPDAVTPLARVERLPSTWASRVAPPGKMLPHCVTCLHGGVAHSHLTSAFPSPIIP